MQPTTMKDIAERVGVSVNTVSRAINDKPDISGQTKKEILQVAEELNYSPNRFARGLRSEKTFTIGVILSDILNPFYSSMLKGVEEAAKERGYRVIVMDTGEDYDNEQFAVETMLAEQVDGLLISPVQKRKQAVIEIQKSDLPFVLLGRYFDSIETNYITTDDVKGAYSATQHLIKGGHKRIALINGPSYISSSKERFKGYKQAMENDNLLISDDLILHGMMDENDGYEALKKLVARDIEPTAVLCYSDFVALGVLQAADEIGLEVPENLAIIGYDDTFFSNYTKVPLTTVKIREKELGKRGFQILTKLIENSGTQNTLEQVRLETGLVVRDSA